MKRYEQVIKGGRESKLTVKEGKCLAEAVRLYRDRIWDINWPSDVSYVGSSEKSPGGDINAKKEALKMPIRRQLLQEVLAVFGCPEEPGRETG